MNLKLLPTTPASKAPCCPLHKSLQEAGHAACGAVSFLSLHSFGGYYQCKPTQHKTQVSLMQTVLNPFLKYLYLFMASCTQAACHRLTRHMFSSIFTLLTATHLFPPSFTNFLSFSWQPTGQKIQKAKLFPVKPTFLSPPYTYMKGITSALFSILIVISFDRTYSLSLKAPITNTILFSSSPSLATNSTACIRVSNSLKTS